MENVSLEGLPVNRRSVLGAGLVAAAVPLLTQGPAAAAVRVPVNPEAEISPPNTGASLAQVEPVPEPTVRALADPSWTASVPGERTEAALPAGLPFSFRYDDFDVHDLRTGARPYFLASPLPLQDTGPHDAEGVRMVPLGGRLYDHPVGQAQYGINLLESYRITGNTEYLARAEKQAQRLVDRRVRWETGWFYPYPFRHRMHRQYDIYEPPWYSMMAQGQALSLFCRLYTVTGKQDWKVAANMTFRSYLVRPQAGKPWGVYVINGLLWFEEYPNPRHVRGDLTYNGHIFAAYGLWDYWVLTGDEHALALLRGALTTARDVHSLVRNRHWRGKYCLAHALDAGFYHSTHIGQHTVLFAMTRDTIFARIAELYYTDHPVPGQPGTVSFAAGSHTGYHFDSAGRVVGRRLLRLTRRSNAPSSVRGKVMRQSGFWYSITAGSLAGYQLREVPGHSFQLGTNAGIRYRLSRPVNIAVDAVRAYTISENGSMSRVTTDYRAGDAASVDLRAVLNGVEHLRLDSGPYAGRWVGYSSVARW